MKATDILRKKRDGKALTDREIKWFVKANLLGEVKDYQVSAFTMAVYLKGMNARETASLTQALMHSGDVISHKAFKGFPADKHSTGGVGDTVSLILAPLVASLGVQVPMVSGRGLGHTGGTLDKLESIPGFRTDLSLDRFIEQANAIGSALIGQTERMCPADKKWYALRDVTATVESIPLIVASIMSKKMAEGIRALVLDVKVGSGAFMKTLEDAETLAVAMVETGRRMGRNVRALITDMNQPLARSAGNALEAAEAIRVLRNEQPGPLKDLSVELSAHMVALAGKYKTLETARKACRRNLENGKALRKFGQMIQAQGGDPRVCEDQSLFARARIVRPYKAKKGGYLQTVDTMGLGLAANALGAGRSRMEDEIDPAVGFVTDVRLGDRVSRGQTLLTLYANDGKKLKEAQSILDRCFTIGRDPVEAPALIKKVVE